MNFENKEVFNLDNNVINQFKEVFLTSQFNIQYNNNSITILSKDNDAENRCFELTFYSDYIYIDSLKKCGITGLQSLKKIIDIASRLNFIKKIMLDDMSGISVCSYEIDLPFMKILTNGMSWYNSAGFISSNFENEVIHNNKMIKLPFSEFMKQVYNNNISNSDFCKKTYIEKRQNIISNKENFLLEQKNIPQRMVESINLNIAKLKEEIINAEEYSTQARDKYIETYNLYQIQFDQHFPNIDKNNSAKDVFINLFSKDNLKCQFVKIIYETINYIKSSNILIYKRELEKIVDTSLIGGKYKKTTPKIKKSKIKKSKIKKSKIKKSKIKNSKIKKSKIKNSKIKKSKIKNSKIKKSKIKKSKIKKSKKSKI